MKDETDHFPGDKCYIFDYIDGFYCVSYESVRVPTVEEAKKIREKRKMKNK